MQKVVQPPYAVRLFEQAQTDREILDVLVSIMKNELKYGHSDFAFIAASDTLLIRGVVAITWDKTDKMFCIGFSVTTEILGAAVLLNCLHLNGVHNIKFQNNFYISECETDDNNNPVIYYGLDAQKRYSDEVYCKNKKTFAKELIENNLMHSHGDKQTYH